MAELNIRHIDEGSTETFQYIQENKLDKVTLPCRPCPLDSLCNCEDVEGKCSTLSCLDRAMCMECPRACGSSCMNRRFQAQRGIRDLQTFQTDTKGVGVTTTVKIREDAFILEYLGEMISMDEFIERTIHKYNQGDNHYCMEVDKNMVLDAHSFGSIGRFVNHSCEPNCRVEKWLVDEMPRIGLFAIRDIYPGEELTYDYKFKYMITSSPQACYCESKKCRGTLGQTSRKCSWGRERRS